MLRRVLGFLCCSIFHKVEISFACGFQSFSIVNLGDLVSFRARWTIVGDEDNCAKGDGTLLFTLR